MTGHPLLAHAGVEVERTVRVAGQEVPVFSSIPVELEHDDSAGRMIADHFDHLQLLAEPPTAVPRLTPTVKRKARRLMSRFAERSIAAAARWHYSQARPMTNLHQAPEEEQSADCSTHATDMFHWADRWLAVTIEDPNGLGYSGFGYTGTLLSRNFAHKVPGGRTYFVGDMALYGPASATRHVVTCFKGGTAANALWASHGSEAGPYAVRVFYRPDFLCVVRGRSLL